MGKRELLLILAFATVGAMVYYATAPPSAPGEQGFSIARILENVRREMHGNRSSAELTTTTTIPLKPGVTEVRFETRNAPLKISGEDRADILCELQVWSSGYDETEAKRHAGETLLKTTEAGVSLVLAIKYPDPGTQRATLIVRMPKALTVRLQPSRSTLEIADVAAVDLAEWRGEAAVRRISGRVTATHRGGTLTIEGVGALKLNTRGSTVVLKDLKAEAVMQLQAGELRAQSLGGPVEVELNGTRLALEDLTTTRRPIRINAIGGSVKLGGIRTETRIDGRDTRIDVAVDQAAPVAIYSEGEEPMEVALPTAGFEVDALATDARLSVPEGLLEVKTTDNEQRASGTIGGGGPTITLRSSHGNITIRMATPAR
jgi:hypothetical protein